MNSSVFISQHEENDYDIDNKITYTEILNSIPSNKTENQILDWKNIYATEWRWRFLKFKVYENNKEIEKHIVEISYLQNNSDERIYFSKYGEWVNRFIDPLFDQFVEKQYYVYALT